jgi:general nucleoside transport system permease protein
MKYLQRSTIQIVSVLLALLIGGVVIQFIGVSPLTAYQALFRGALGSTNAISETLIKMVPLIFTGLSYAIAYKAGLINIGAEGQLYIGAIMATLAGTGFQGLPMILHLPLTLAAGFLGGGMWGLFVGWLKVRFGANEIITTVMLNYVAVFMVSFLVTGPMKAPPGDLPQSRPILPSAVLIRFLPGTRLHLGIFLALAALVLYYIYVWRMKAGYELRVVGQNMEAARYAGMKPEKVMLMVMFLAGGMGGLAGTSEIIGVQGRLMQQFSPGYGFDGIAVALVGMNTPPGILLGAVLFGMLRAGGNMMQMVARVPLAVISIIQALVIIFVICGQMAREALNKRMKLQHAAETLMEGETDGSST